MPSQKSPGKKLKKSGVRKWVSREKLAVALGCHPNSISRFCVDHADAPGKRANGEYNLPAWLSWQAQHPEIEFKVKEGVEHASIRAALDAERLRKLKIQNDRDAGVFLLAAEACAGMRDITELVTSKLRAALEDELPGLIQHRPAAEIRTHNKELVNRLCRDLQEGINALIERTTSR